MRVYRDVAAAPYANDFKIYPCLYSMATSRASGTNSARRSSRSMMQSAVITAHFGQRKRTDPTTYLAGGTDFGSALPSGFYAPGYGNYVGPDIITRSLTPDKTGRAEGGHTFEQFREIIRTGVDLDHIRPTCKSSSDPNAAAGICIPPPVDGNLLQVMPWPDFQDMTDHDLRAIYEYLSAIPCIDNTSSTPPAGAPNELHNNCK